MFKKRRTINTDDKLFHADKTHIRKRRKQISAYEKLFLPGYDSARKNTSAFFIGLFVVLCVAGCIYVIFFSPFFRISDIKVKNLGTVVTLSPDEITDRFVNLYGQNLLFVQVEDMLRDIIVNNPRIHKIEAHKIFPRTIEFTFYEYEILGSVQDSITKEWSLINQNSMVVESHLKEPPPGLVRITFLNQKSFSESDTLFDPEDINFMVEIMNLFYKTTGFPITAIETNPVAYEYRLQNSRGFTVWCSSEMNPEVIITFLNAVISQVTLDDEYKVIDLRIPNKAFICYKEGGCIPAVTTSE